MIKTFENCSPEYQITIVWFFIFLTLLCMILVIYEGTGTVNCAHGTLPIPVPAVNNIVSSHHLPIHIDTIKGELVTPTGAAIAASIVTSHTLPSTFTIKKTGIGAGKRAYERPSLLRAMLIETTPRH